MKNIYNISFNSLGESWIKHELEAEQGFLVDSEALTCPEQE